MGVNVTIEGSGEPNGLHVGENGDLRIVLIPAPPVGIDVPVLPFRQYMTDDGFSTGSNDMAVNGSASYVDFSVASSQDYDIYIKSLAVIIGDGGSPALNKFGALAALATGVQWIYKTSQFGEYILHEGIKTNIEFIRLAVDTGAIGTGTDAYLADVSGGGTEKSYLPVIDMNETYGLAWGLKLNKGTKDKLVFRVNDNLSGLTTFNIIAYGSRI